MSTAVVRDLRLVAPEPTPSAPAAPSEGALRSLGYEPTLQVLMPPPRGPVFDLRVCRVEACEATGRMTAEKMGMCRSCLVGYRRSGLDSVEAFAARPRVRSRAEVQNLLCAICCAPGHQRALDAYGFCEAHLADFRRRLKLAPRLTRVGYRSLDDVGPLPTVANCAVGSCGAPVSSAANQLCRGHKRAWMRHCAERGRDAGDVVAQGRWASLAYLPPSRWLDLGGLAPSFRDELLLGLAATVELGGHISFTEVRAVVNAAVRYGLLHLVEWAGIPEQSTTGRRAADWLAACHRRATSSPATERHLDVWDLRIWGFPKGRVRFDAISQPWLKQLAKAYAFADVPTRGRNAQAAQTTTRYVGALATLSESLAHRSDGGLNPEDLGRGDIERFLDHLFARQTSGQWSADVCGGVLARLRVVFAWASETGHLDPASCGYILDPTFAVRAADVPPSVRRKRGRPEEEPGKAYTPSQMAVFVQHLPAVEGLATAKARAAMELVIVTGRRPVEICNLRADCLRYDLTEREDGQEVRHAQLRYYASKVRRWHTIYIDEATAALVRGLIEDAQQAFPGVADKELCLFPRRINSRYGREPVSSGWLTKVFFTWRRLPAIAECLGSRDVDARLYDFRHSFAQRHADAGVPIDVLQELMGHVAADSTRHYYDVSRERRRQAVGVMRRFRFDREGVLLDAGRREILDHEYQRAGLAGVAVPLGECSHPSMLRPGDQRCPVRYRCMGCPAFSTSVDRLPELRAYLDELLRSRESILASDLAEWAKQDALPMSDEIDQVERLVVRAEQLLGDLPAEQRAEVENAIAVYRAMRDEIRDRVATPVLLRVRADGAPVNLWPRMGP